MFISATLQKKINFRLENFLQSRIYQDCCLLRFLFNNAFTFYNI